MNEKEFEKQQLEQLLNDLKDIDKYTSFKNGAFIYDLGKYQGSLLVNHINNLQSKIDKVIKLCETEKKYIYDYAGRDEKTGKLLKGNKIELDVVNKSKILDILKEDK